MFNLLYTSESSANQEVLISLDAQKAFDCIEHSYLSRVFDKFDFGPVFQTWMKVLYVTPQVAVRTNSILSEYFPIGRGTRQGCPLSPLLFHIAIEPFAIALRSSPEVKVIERDSKHKVSMYADDSMICVTNPSISIPAVL